MYARVSLNTVEEVLKALPSSYIFADGSRTGNFYLMEPEVHQREGFYPLEDNKPEYDLRYQYLTPSGFEILSEKVIRHWQIMERDIETLKEEKYNALNARRDQAIASSFTYNQVVFDSDANSLRDITSMAANVALGIPLPEGFSWRAADNSDIVMSDEDVRSFAVAARDHVYGKHLVCRQHKAAIEALTSASEVAAYDIETGW